MEEADTFAILSSMVATHTQEIASSKNTEPTMRPMSINEMSQVAPKTYRFCSICGVQGHYGFECSYNVYNYQDAQLEQMISFEEGYGYTQYSNPCDQEWVDQSSFSYMDNDVRDSSYYGQQYHQQHYEEYYEPPLQQYQYPHVQEEPQVSLTNVAIQAERTNVMLKELMHEINELKSQQVTIGAQIAELVSSSTSWQSDSSPSPSFEIKADMNAIILTSDQEYDSFSMLGDEVLVEKVEMLITDDKINDVVLVDNVSEDEAAEENNTEMVVVSLQQLVLKLPFPNQNITHVDSWFGIEALMFHVHEDGKYGSIFLINDLTSQDVRMNPGKVRSAGKPPPEPPPQMNVKGVQSFNGCEFYRCFITNFSKTIKSLHHLFLVDVIVIFTNDCLENFCRRKITFQPPDAIFGGMFMVQEVDIRPLLK